MTLPVVIGVVLVLLGVVLVLYPVLRRAADKMTPPLDHDAGDDNLAARRVSVYRELLDLEFDWRVGKLSAEDYYQLCQALKAQAAELLRLEEQTDRELEERLEREVAALRQRLHHVDREGSPAEGSQ